MNEQLESGTYEIIKNRLNQQSKDLLIGLEKLNQARKEVFGAVESKLLATERVTTHNNCVPRDMVVIGESLFLFGYNVFIGLKSETGVSDVLSAYSFRENAFHEENVDFLKDPAFLDDFKNLYKYYRHATFSKFALLNQHLYMIFQVGKSVTDIKALKWTVKNNTLEYVDNRSDHEFSFPNQHEFQWKKSGRNDHRKGLHPHISIEDIIFVETINGDLTIKVEDNTDSGKGIFNEAVLHTDQTLDDAEVYYALIGNLVVLKIKPYLEENFRFIVYNKKIQEAIRIDALEDSCVLLPDDQGIIFAKGYYLQTGEFKLFDNQLQEMLFEKRVTSPNGEDFLYAFYNRTEGNYILLHYNIIEQKVATPIVCHGFSFFENGVLLYFNSDDEQKKHHAIQIWQTPFYHPDFNIITQSDTKVFHIGNKDIVRAMAEMTELIQLLHKEDSYQNLYLDIVKLCNDINDGYYWLSDKEIFSLQTPLLAIRDTASTAIEEYEKVVRIKKNTEEKTIATEAGIKDLLSKIKRERFEEINAFVDSLNELRHWRGAVSSLKELRYIDLNLVEKNEEVLKQQYKQTSTSCVRFLLKKDALRPYQKQIQQLEKSLQEAATVSKIKTIEKDAIETGNQLEMLIEIVSNLKIDDANHTTNIIDNISTVYTRINQINAALKQKRKSLFIQEGKTEFNAQLKLIQQAVINYLDISDNAEKCDEYLSKLMVKLEELEGKFADFEEFTDKLIQKREEIYQAFESKKIQLTESRNRRTNQLEQSAERIITSIKNRLRSFSSEKDINGYLASDIMVDKLRDIIQLLFDLGDSVKADRLDSQLKSTQSNSLRELKDKKELFDEGTQLIRFGEHKFSVNTQKLDLSTVYHQGEMQFHLNGTNFFESIENAAFLETKPVWEQQLISENKTVYRAEYLAWKFYQSHDHFHELETHSFEELQKKIQAFMATRYNEAYIKGIHDFDATQIFQALLKIDRHAGFLSYHPTARVCAQLFWKLHIADEDKMHLSQELQAMGNIVHLFPEAKHFKKTTDTLQEKILAFNKDQELFDTLNIAEAGLYLFQEISAGHQDFIIDGKAAHYADAFVHYLKLKKAHKNYDSSLKKLSEHPIAQFKLLVKWLEAYNLSATEKISDEYIAETALFLKENNFHHNRITTTPLSEIRNDMKGDHTRIDEKKYLFDHHSFKQRLHIFQQKNVPAFEQYIRLKKSITEDYKKELRLEEFMPRVLSSFVRNKLIDSVYLPLIGANLAKQIGTAGDSKRTDLMGMLLLISPPGYGKTTLMEYLAAQLGIIFMKINGPAIGHRVLSLDPEEAPNMSAKEELEKLNLSFEMGDNVMIYLDDIQHCNPEFLQKFISLCDGQRKIEGVYKGVSKTYDLRGKKVCVVMAGNPYTESGDKFRIPDMLANRADIYNLGDVIGDAEDNFKLSYIENSLTSNKSLSRLAEKSRKDLHAFLQIAAHNIREGLDFEAEHSAEETQEYVTILKKMLQVRDVILRVNQEYIHSAAQSDEYRTEPAFKLQGSYRDMNKMAEKINPLMNDDELQVLIHSHYESESQTLTSDAEANFLKYKAITGKLNGEEKERWAHICKIFMQQQKRKGYGNQQQMDELLKQISQISASLKKISEG